jgi:hypothetical protein
MRPLDAFRIVLAFASLLSLTPAWAQESRATLSGTVIDPSGASISGAKLTLVTIETSTPASTG